MAMQSSNRFVLSAFLAVVGLLLVGSTAFSSIITSDPSLPPMGGVYLAPADVHATYSGGALTIVLSQIQHQPFASPPVIRTVTGSDEEEIFSSGATGMVSVNGSPAIPSSLQGPVRTEVFGKVGNTTGTFETEMLSMDLSGGSAMIRESPTLHSLGQTTITDIGGGLYRIDSFFDIFTELSIDGGQSWMPDTSGPARVVLGSIPEPTTVIIWSLLGIGAITVGWWRRKV
jgi:hypothetical protein